MSSWTGSKPACNTVAAAVILLLITVLVSTWLLMVMHSPFLLFQTLIVPFAFNVPSPVMASPAVSSELQTTLGDADAPLISTVRVALVDSVSSVPVEQFQTAGTLQRINDLFLPLHPLVRKEPDAALGVI